MTVLRHIFTTLLLIPSIAFAQLSTEHSIKAGPEILKEGVAFEVKNKGKYPIEVMVKQLPHLPVALTLQPKSDALRISRFNFSLEQPVYLTIRELIPAETNAPFYQYLFPTNVQQIIVKWEDGKLQAQKGSIFGYSESGIPLKGNVRTQDIVRMR
ncbi:hypothetical protein Noda2021_12570 [Candidatus Dependentiae bacterium Noda2021]|nr:hypothetical protein Noda2021_12570 [Candidatus Dependentiae bacterium Noda2021]